MNGNLLDTSVIVNILRGDTETIDFLSSLEDDIFIPVIAIGELLYGANKSTRVKENTKLVDDLLEDFEILPVDDKTAEVYARIKAWLERAGYQLPENDLWIAATAMKYGLKLATFDSHFKYINNLDTVGIE